MQKSIETRWFLPGPAPPEVIQWFQDEMAMSQPTRTDTYLHTTNVHELGIKLREGCVEIKQRLNVIGHHTFHPAIDGIVESWGKWSFAIDPSNPPTDLHSDFWIRVTKQRIIRRYQVTTDGRIRAVPGQLFPLQRSTIEIANIIIHGTPWWSLNLEAVGTDVNLYNALQVTADLFFMKNGSPTLTTAQSFSYPQWLDVVIESL